MEGNVFMHDKKLVKSVSLFLLILSLFFVVKIVNEIRSSRFIGSDVFPNTTITVSGEGEIFAVPDIAQFSFSVVEERLTIAAAQDAAAKKLNSAIEFLERSGVEERDIKTTSYNLYPRYEYRTVSTREVGANELIAFPPDRERVLIGYEVRQSVSVKVRDTEKAGDVLAGLGDSGVSDISGLNFTIDDETELQREARELAIDDAKEKAEKLAGDLGVTLVRIVTFNEAGDGSPPVRFFAQEAAFDSAGAGAVPEIPVGENVINTQVTITYEIR